jgi:hypothetical protein
MNQEEFLKKIESALAMRIGHSMAGSLLKNNVSKMKKPVGKLDTSDMLILIENITQAVRLFERKDESQLINEDLQALLKTLE